MTDNSHPITPPPELVQQWWEEADQYQDDPKTYFDHVATEAAQWGADQELEACVKWIAYHPPVPDQLRAARRPKPPSLKEQALEILGYPGDFWSQEEVDTIRRALEQLDD